MNFKFLIDSKLSLKSLEIKGKSSKAKG